jgi:hypothetical protein
MLRWSWRLAVTLSFVLCIATLALWLRSYANPQFFTRLYHADRYTILNGAGTISLHAPPRSARDPDIRARAELIVSRIHNDQLHWKGWDTDVLAPPELDIEYPVPIYRSYLYDAQTKFASADLSRPLLAALEDPNRVAAAHYLLLAKPGPYWEFLRSEPIPGHTMGKCSCGEIDDKFSREEADHHFHDPWAKVNFGGLTLIFNRWKNPESDMSWTFSSLGMWIHDVLGDPEPASATAVRDRWHSQLDISVVTIHHRNAAAITSLLPLMALVRFIRRKLHRRRIARLNLCHHCFYDLTANISGICPECGNPIEGGKRGSGAKGGHKPFPSEKDTLATK